MQAFLQNCDYNVIRGLSAKWHVDKAILMAYPSAFRCIVIIGKNHAFTSKHVSRLEKINDTQSIYIYMYITVQFTQ